MKKVTTTTASLLGSSSALGINWMYDRPYLENYLTDKNPLFLPIDHDAYAASKNGYDVYPNHQVGDVDFMGEMVYLLHQYLEHEPKKDVLTFRQKLYDFFGPQGTYDGYVEAYGKELVKTMNEEKTPIAHTDYLDSQLIGPALFLAVYDHPKSVNKVADSLHYAKVLTSYSGVNYFNNMLYNIFKELEAGKDKLAVLEDNIQYAPKKYQLMLKKAVTEMDLESFLEKYAGIACDLKQSFPLIYYIVAHTNSWEEALQLNASLGGASSARGMFISAIFNLIDDIPDSYLKKLNYKI